MDYFDIDKRISSSLEKLAEQKFNLSVVIADCILIAYEIKDFDNWYILSLYLLSGGTKERNQQIHNQYIEKCIEIGMDELSISSKIEKTRKELLDTLAINNDQVFYGSISFLEKRIEEFKDLLQQKLPEGLHPVDLYFKQEQKEKADILIRNILASYIQLYEKIRTCVYMFLLETKNMLSKTNTTEKNNYIVRKNIFIIHGHNEAKWRELEKILKEDFSLNPIVLNQEPNQGMTIIEKFEYYAKTCSYAFAIFTPDDIIHTGTEQYLQARPNVIFELGWFYSNLGRSRVCILNQDSVEIPSDLQGILRHEFKSNISELFKEIQIELSTSQLINIT
jgi:predicted nucleotide-binding protein